MDSLIIAGIVFACTFGGALLGMYLRAVLPDTHLCNESKDVMKMGTGLIATISALVLGLLIASAKSSFDAQRTGFHQLAANLVLLDGTLAHYGPEAKPTRDLLRLSVAGLIDNLWPAEGSRASGMDSKAITVKGREIVKSIQDLSPQTDLQRSLRSQALQIANDLSRTRWLLAVEEGSSIPIPFLVILVFWLFVLFTVFGLFSPRNPTVIAVLFVCALSVAGALFLIVDLDRPFQGMFQISSAPMQKALLHLGH